MSKKPYTPSPNSENAEQCVLGTMLAYRNSALHASEFVSSKDFFQTGHGPIFDAILSLVFHDKPTDVQAVAEILASQKIGGSEQTELDRLPRGVEYLHYLKADATPPSSLRFYASVVAEMSLKRDVAVAGQKITELGMGEVSSVDAIDQGISKLTALLDGRASDSSWVPIEDDEYWDDPALEVSRPGVVGQRVNGDCLWLPGKRGLVIAPRESGKSLLMLSIVVEAALRSEHSVFVDFESRPPDVYERLKLHVNGAAARPYFHYVRPTTAMRVPDQRRVSRMCAELKPRVVILDGFNALLARQGLSGNDATDIAKLYETVVEPWWSEDTTVIMVDHVSKEDNRMGFKSAMGSVAKENLVDFVVAVEVPETGQRISRGAMGHTTLVVTKDRHGGMRSLCYDKQTFGNFTVRSDHNGRWQHGITMPEGMSGPALTWSR